jgi:polyhydroxyalkanoate synthesis regulator phasin
LKARLGEIEDWKNKCSKMEITITNYSVVEGNNKNLQNQVDTQAQQINDLKNKLGRS